MVATFNGRKPSMETVNILYWFDEKSCHLILNQHHTKCWCTVSCLTRQYDNGDGRHGDDARQCSLELDLLFVLY
jgi:hypothetical protein